MHYADYASWQQDLLAQVGDAHRQFWTDALRDAPDELPLPTDRPRPSEPTGAGGALHRDLDAHTVAALGALANHHKVSMLMVVHAAVAALLHRIGAGTDIVTGTPVAGRDDTALGDVVGLFINTVVLRADVSGNPRFDELLARVRDTDLAAFAHAELPFDQVVDALKPPRVHGRNPLFNVFIAHHRRDGDDSMLFGMSAHWHEHTVSTAIFDLGFTVTDTSDGGGVVTTEYSSDLFDGSTAHALTERLVAVLDQVARDSTVRIAELDVLAPAEQASLAARNDTGHVVEATSLASMVTAQARRSPHACAVRDHTGELTYAELDEWSDRLAARLIGAGAGPGTLIGVRLPRCVELVVALVAVTKTGAAFLPLDPEYPGERIDFMIADATPAEVLDDVADIRGAQYGPPPASLPDPHPASWAYVLYTSGSTGTPKGVAVAHAGIVNRIAWLQHAYPLDDTDRMLVKTPISFDTSVWEVFWPLSTGATLVIARPGGHREPRYLAEVIADERVTAVDFVPSMLEVFLDEPAVRNCRSLTRVTVGGEALSTELARRFGRICPHTPLHNLYGPTEASVDVLNWTADGGPVALGLPGWNVRAHVLDIYLNPVPDNVAGELYLAGTQLADGYLHRHGLTAERFVANPYTPGTRMYRTGDLVRWRVGANGAPALEYLGRTDEQIKLRGVRIEPGEIEAVLDSHPAIASARVVARGDRLLAYYLPTGHPADEPIRDYASRHLPLHMVPSDFVELTVFPLTPSGKLDKRALPVPQRGSTSGRPPSTTRQHTLCALFGEVLQTPVTTVDADFFELGGHSLLLVRLASAIRREFPVVADELSVGDLMVASTVSAVDRLLSGEDRHDSFAPILPVRTGGTAPPLFCLPPASGLSWPYTALKRHVPQQIPIYALQSPLFSGGALPDDLTELVHLYTDTITGVAPTGPIRVLGWSFGGVLALLVAQELVRRGRDVGYVGMLDSYPHVSSGEFDREAVLASVLSEMGFAADVGDRLTVPEAIDLMRAHDDAIAILDDTQIAAAVENYIAAEKFTVRADYGRYDGEVFFVDAALEDDRWGVASQAWRRYIPGSLRVMTVQCRHADVLGPTALDEIGPVLAADLTHRQD